MNQDILNKFSTQLREAFAHAIDLAWELQQDSIPPIFILWSIANQEGSAGADVLKKYHITAEDIRVQFPLDASTGRVTPVKSLDGKTHTVSFLWPEFSAHSKRVIERGAVAAFELEHTYIGTEHILLALIEKADEAITQVLKSCKASDSEMTKHIIMSMNTAQAIHTIQRTKSSMHEHTPKNETATTTTEQPVVDTSETPALDFFGVELTSDHEQKKLSPVIGRATEIERVIQVLSRKNKNNPVLIGDPGVGKTAIVEGLAQRIHAGNVPDILLGKRIIVIDLTLLISGTMYRGDYESRLKAIIEELKNNPDIIAFIDEVHTIVGNSGGNTGAPDTANILKPALARGEPRCIGATTPEEYRKSIEADSALERRFQPVTVDEPSLQGTRDILNGVRGYFESFHRVTFAHGAVDRAIELAGRYMSDRRFPDKAIDIIDEAGAAARSKRALSVEEKKLSQAIQHLRRVRKEKIQAVKQERFQDAIELKKKEDAYTVAIDELKRAGVAKLVPVTPISLEDIERVVAQMCHVPERYVHAAGNTEAHHIEEVIDKRIFGQHEAIATITSVLKRSLAGLSDTHKPLGSFLFIGPSGVGKTSAARALAETLFHSKDSLLHMNMAEFSEGFAVTKMLGAPAGYVGHKDSIKFIDHIRRHPYSVVLFDDIEKAHPDVLNVIIQMIDRGVVTDSTGRTVQCNHCVCILTSQVAMDTFTKQAELGFVEEAKAKKLPVDKKVHTDLSEQFPADLLNALDACITFAPLSQSAVMHVVRREITQLNARLKVRKLALRCSPEAIRFLATEGFKPESGARGVHQAIVRNVENPLADKILTKTYHAGETITVTIKEKALHWSAPAEPKKPSKKKKK